jgi:large subunit ribosomal protein L25
MAEILNVELRERRGKRGNRRLRAAGIIPAVLYGHGLETVSLSVSAHELEAAVRHGSRLVKLTGAVNQQAFVRELQWDTWGTGLLHADFARVSEHERIEVEVPLELRGEAPGLKEGGLLEQMLHSIELECEATDIPEKLYVNVNHLGLHGSITASELKLPGTATIRCEPDTVIVQCVETAVAPEEEEVVVGEAAEAEPEVIGRKAEETGEGGEKE